MVSRQPSIQPTVPAGSDRRSRQNQSHSILLVGNPNVGKSVLFTKMTGKSVNISNYPGTTVEIARGKATIQGTPFAAIDTPGINELAAHSEEARVTCQVLSSHPYAIIVQVADAKNLRRALLLTLQLSQLDQPMVLVLNMMDELADCGGAIQVRRLEEILGVAVVPTIAIEATGIQLLQQKIAEACLPAGRPCPSRCIPNSTDELNSQAKKKLPLGELPAPRSYEQTTKDLHQVNRILAETYTVVPNRKPTLSQRLGWWATHPFKGLLILGVILYFTFWFVGLLGAGTAVDFFENVLFARYLNPLSIQVVDAALPFPHRHETGISTYTLKIPVTPNYGFSLHSSTLSVLTPAYAVGSNRLLGPWAQVERFIHDFLVGQYGVITMALSYSLAIVLPIVTTFFLLFSILEDSGYLARLAIMVNRLFRAMGLNGKAVLPMVLGLGCDTMATMTTRVLETRKERVITTLLLALAIPCSAQLGILLAMLARVSWMASIFWVGLMIVIIFTVGWLAAQLYGGQPSDFILELPPMRAPQMGNVAMKTMSRLEWYLKEVIPLFVLGTGILFLLEKAHLLSRLSHLGEPLVKGWLGLPAEMSNAFLIGFLRRDYGAVYLLDAATSSTPTLSSHQILVAMVTLTLFMPCIANLFMISRELGTRTAALITLFIFPFAFLVGGLVNHGAQWFGI